MTEKGLVKFNGVDVVVYDEKNGLFVNRDVGNQSALRAMYIEGGPDNKLVLGFHNIGISIFNGIEMKSLTPKDGLPTAPINELFKDSKGNIWAGAFSTKSSDLGLV